ncbi:MAG: hypothetical protein FGF53_09810 [Candidatus Brockarchaeota archaeon]|nr:hypothetical protein [Candidatus Brockarchaeota archaeon]
MKLLRVLAWEFKDRSKVLLVLAMYLTLLFALQFRVIGLQLGTIWAGSPPTMDDVLSLTTGMVTFPFVMIYRLVSPLIAILTCVCFSYEYETGVLRSLMLKPVGKTTIFLAKTVYVILASCLAFVSASAVYMALAEPRVLTSILSSSLLPLIILAVGAHYATIFLLVISIASLFSTVLRKTALSTGLSLLVVYMLDYVGSIASSLRDTLPPWSMWEHIHSVRFLIEDPSSLLPLLTGEPLKAAVISLMLLAFSWLMFTRVTEYG